MARFTNQAQLRYGNEITNSNIAVGEITEVLSATKTAVRDTYGQNENVTYVISIVNSGTTAFNGITVTDNLGEYLFNTRELTPKLIIKIPAQRPFLSGNHIETDEMTELYDMPIPVPVKRP